MRKTDISRYTGTPMPDHYNNEAGEVAISTAKTILLVVWRVLATILMVGLCTGVIVGISMLFYVASLSGETVDVDLRTMKLDQTSFIYELDENGNFVESQSVQAIENREWVEFDQIPKQMKDAIVAIEDKRFYDHHGVDWKRTAGAILGLATGNDMGGGSTLTQQLIKNITDDNDVSLTRKLREIFRALNFEKRYTKDEILEMYLNYVNFGSGTRGVQAAANLYFDKDIQNCSIAECAAIAGITQNPVGLSPLLHPQANKDRREDVLDQMHEQGKIDDAEYAQAIKESATMTFAEQDDENIVDYQYVNDWYVETMLQDIINDLVNTKHISTEAADDLLRKGGLKIYCAKDRTAQKVAQEYLENQENLPDDTDIQVAFTMMDYNGRMLAVVGQRGEKEGNLLMNYAAYDAPRQPGSSIKPIAVYAPAIDMNLIHYSSKIKDEPIEWDADGDGVLDNNWPPNWYNNPPYYKDQLLLPKALEISSNATAAQVLVGNLGLQNSFNFLTQKLGISTLDPTVDMLPSGLATGGAHNGITLQEMTAAFQIFGNGGMYNKPYTYYYVEDDQGNAILDNRENIGTQAISSQSSTIMRHLLYQPIYGTWNPTATRCQIPGTTVYGKTGTTDQSQNSWFIGGTPYAVAGIWLGHPTPADMTGTEANFAKSLWPSIMSAYIDTMAETKDFTDDESVLRLQYCTKTGLLANKDKCTDTDWGYYSPSFIPQTCTGEHDDGTSSAVSSTAESSSQPVSSVVSSQAPSSEPSSEPPVSSEEEPSEAPSSDPDDSTHENPSSEEARNRGR